jgi:hypothetical protein
MRVYLSGGMEYADGEGAQWRTNLQQWLEQELGHEVFNPNIESSRFFSTYYPSVDFRKLKFENIQLYQKIARSLVEIDCKEIAERSDYIICYWDEGAAKGAGTKGELTMAKFFNKPIYLVTSFDLPDIPGWVLGCVSTILPDFTRLKQELTKRFKNTP